MIVFCPVVVELFFIINVPYWLVAPETLENFTSDPPPFKLIEEITIFEDIFTVLLVEVPALYVVPTKSTAFVDCK